MLEETQEQKSVETTTYPTYPVITDEKSEKKTRKPRQKAADITVPKADINSPIYLLLNETDGKYEQVDINDLQNAGASTIKNPSLRLFVGNFSKVTLNIE